MLKWIGRIALGIVALAVVAVAGVYAASEAIIRRKVDSPLPVISASTDPQALARGAYQARIRGCDGCHTRTLQGENWLDDAAQGRIWTTNLTQVLGRYSDAQLARAVRSGVRSDGTALWLMPSETWTDLSDQDTADIVAWLRSHPATGQATPPIRFGPLMRLAIVLGRVEPATAHVAAAKTKPAFDAGTEFAHGRYLAVTTCAECHGSDLGGAEVNGSVAPDLIVASGYDAAQFDRFMRTGIAPDGRERGFMSEMAREHFATITKQDLDDIHAYLNARAERMPQG
ncbi:c-type cytochrome [Brevundimonas sp. NIBR11]|uniref:c-type cytochrome n=1 Tax=Brevundimonas sp. NIBR11 TaxID=3015999 RepID=UPI0022F09CEE|nr:c-type cytochrome [Brevundimonas sp. NIBR11]WGM31709.1 Alcohol dehydrogenase (quinone), cytochrome c subunit [Brevundimonas sp. NIBR11]